MQVGCLAPAPPRSISPGVRHDVDLLRSREASAGTAARGDVLFDPAHAAVQLHADLVRARRIVGLRHVERVEVLAAFVAIARLHDPASHRRRVAASAPETCERLIETDAGRKNLFGSSRGLCRCARVEEAGERRVDSRRRLCPRRDHDDRREQDSNTRRGGSCFYLGAGGSRGSPKVPASIGTFSLTPLNSN